jgi:LuxR family maltose regulon positive regulatory protein
VIFFYEMAMSRPNFFLRTKLLPPRVASETLPRPRLTSRLEANLGAPITLVAADAGCGKTTLIADFVRNSSRRYVWYQLDHTDADPFVFLGYIVHGIRKLAPGFGETVLQFIEKAADEFLRFPERAVDLLLNEILDAVDQPFILVLDDYHHIGRETVVHRIVDRLLQYSSEILHLIITTRDLPPLAIMRRKTQSAALVITREDLLFTDDEMRELFRKTLNVELNAQEIAEYRERTDGWITALQLVRQVAEQELHAHSDPFELNLGEVLHQSEKDIFDYFAEEVLSHESEETQNLLLRLSLLESLPLDVCSRLFPDMRCAAVLPELVQKNVFLTVAGDGGAGEEVYRLHPLFRDFLQRRLRSEIGRTGVERERNRIAEFFFAENQWEKAMPFWLQTENFEKATAIIAEKGGEWIESGAITPLDNFISKIPDEVLEKHPRALLHKAEIARLRGETEKSSIVLSRALKIFSAEKDRAGEAEALHSLASLARRRGDIETALKHLEKAEKLVSARSETFLKCANTRGLCYVGQGNWTQAENQFRRALELAEELGNEHYIRLVMHNLALPAGFRGDFGEALRWFKRIFSDEKSETVPQEAIGHLNVARLHLFRGELTEAERHLERALEICQIFNLKALRGEVFEAYGNLHRERMDFARAAEFYERAARAYEDADISTASRDLDEERAKFYLARGDAGKARGLLENLLAEREKTKNEFGIKTVRLNLCRVRLAEGAAENPAPELEKLVEFFHGQNLNYDEAVASLALAVAYSAAGRRREMFAPLERALDLSARFDYEYWLRGEIRANPQFFADEEVNEKLPPDLREISLEPGSESRKRKAEKLSTQLSAPSTQRSALSAIADLTVRTFGFVEIFRDETKPFAPDAWTTRRARDIFCYIATSRHRRVEKDVLIDVFWGEDDPKTVEKNFHPTISHIRKALNSRQPFKQNFLVFRDGAYQLNPELVYAIDTEQFEEAVALAEKAKRENRTEDFRAHLETAHALYRGEYLAGVYDDWAEQRRTVYAEQFARVLNALAKIAAGEKKWSNALKYAHEILQIDPFREDAHRLLMRVFAAQGKRSAVVEQFESLQKLLKDELGVAPAPETRRLFRELTR